MKSSVSMETIVVSANNEALSDSQERSQSAVRVNEFEAGKYLFIPMKHFCVDVMYNGKRYASKRVIVLKVSDDKKTIEYPRTWKISYFTESLAGLKADGMPDVTPETRENTGRLRLPAGSVTYTSSCTNRIPKSITPDKFLHIDAPFFIEYTGTLDGYVARYNEVSDKVWDIAVNEETGKAVFDLTRITQFTVLPDAVDDKLIAEAKKAIKADSQLSGIAVD